MDKPPSRRKPDDKPFILGLGLDGDGHKRITTGPDFILFGGKERTHEEMTEKVLKIKQELAARGKSLADVGVQELADVVHTVERHRRRR